MRALVLALALLIALVPAAQAQDDEARRTAREAYRRGEDAFARGEHELALALFRELYERTGHDAVRYNVGVCLEQLGRAREARVEFLAVAESEAVPAETRAQALEAAARVRARLAAIEVRGAPDAAGVTIDGVRVCALPCDELIDPGAHTIALDVPDGPSERIEIAAGATRTVELVVVAREVVPHPAPIPPASSGASLGPLTVIGASLVAIGAGGVIGFGVYTMDLKSRFDAMPTQPLADEGNTMAALTNASIGVLALGGALVLIDVILVATSGPPERAVSLEGGTLRVAF
ncbi:tetratricopeptide repeat protein [Sandaracinus amylolyticus]|uniref:PEGA domain protein n=1 Tax=Sandaracinus amylolyticus TaxID=927083 RepID=A0A0F6W6I1_9BACT|nr:tetratricopeptide repeat protein [Sandaracinus amylolyticus]AKF08750.1 PEGA domain protein [Sandaracinus amylolyticus]